jgi:hypothetical protein
MCFFVGFVLGITHEVGVPLFLVILPLKSHGKPFDFGGFWVLGVLEVCTRFAFPPFLESFGA